jgi:hypothetical protein
MNATPLDVRVGDEWSIDSELSLGRGARGQDR